MVLVGIASLPHEVSNIKILEKVSGPTQTQKKANKKDDIYLFVYIHIYSFGFYSQLQL